jgi:hypothetical protein
MGCDIHFFRERFTSDNNYSGPRDLSEDRNIRIEQIIDDSPVIKRWVAVDLWELVDNDYWSCHQAYSERNYYVFSILADVRNSSLGGQGRVDTIDYPRGIPNDASSAYLYYTNKWSGDGHSHSYFTLKELLEVDWSEYDQEYIKNFLNIIEDLKSIDPDPNNVRICFFFDN